MISRVANSLYWMSRYIERAENIARIVDVNLQLLLDFRDLDDQRLARYWMPIIQSTGDEELFFQLKCGRKSTGSICFCARRKRGKFGIPVRTNSISRSKPHRFISRD